MSLIPVKKIEVKGNVRIIPGIEDISQVGFKELPTDEKDRIKELADSIKQQGMVHAISVKSLKGGRYRLVVGWRRLMAHKYLGRDKIVANVIKGKTEDEAILQLIENVQRDDLDAMSIAQGLDVIRREKGIKKQDSLAKLVGKSSAWVSQHLSLLKADPAIQEAVSNKEVGISGARALASLPKGEQADALKSARKEAKEAGDVDKKTGKPKVKTKGARRQARKRKRATKAKQTPIKPVAEREEEQKTEVLAAFKDDVFGQTKMTKPQEEAVEKFWDYLYEIGRLVIKA